MEALHNWQPPRQAKHVQQLLGLTNYYWTFIPGFASLTALLTRLLQKRTSFQWSTVEQGAFESLK